MGQKKIIKEPKKVKPIATDERIKELLEECGGYITDIAKKLGYSWWGIRRRISNNPELEEIYEGFREQLVDEAERSLKSKVQEGDSTAIIFTLRTLGKARGYEQKYSENGNGGPITVIVRGSLEEPNPKQKAG